MYTLINTKTKIVSHTGLSRKRMEVIKDNSMQFLFESEVENTSVANITKYNKKEHDIRLSNYGRNQRCQN